MLTVLLVYLAGVVFMYITAYINIKYNQDGFDDVDLCMYTIIPWLSWIALIIALSANLVAHWIRNKEKELDL